MSHITIFSASIGSGHNQASKALKEQLELKGQSVTIVDTFKAIHPLFQKMVLELYLYMIKKAPRLWGSLYKYSADYSLYLLLDHLGSIFCKPLQAILEEQGTTIMVSTHPFATAFLSKLKQKNQMNTPLYTVITDLGFHPAYIRPEINGYFTGALQRKDQLKRSQPIGKELFFQTGIPISAVPHPLVPREESREKLQLYPEIKTILITGGGLGLVKYVDVLHALECLEDSVQIVCMTGMNKKVLKQIETIKSKHVIKAIPYTDQFLTYVRASDVILSKAGGLTMSEALACETPVIVFQPVPGHEEENADYLIEIGTAVKVNHMSELVGSVKKVLFDDFYHSTLVQNARKEKRPYAAKDIAEMIERLEQRLAK